MRRGAHAIRNVTVDQRKSMLKERLQGNIL